MEGVYDTITKNIRDTDSRTERANRPKAKRFYEAHIIPKLEDRLGSKCTNIIWVDYNLIDKLQSKGIDGYFEFADGTKIEFQEKTHLTTTLSDTERWNPIRKGPAFAAELVNHGGKMGWTQHLNNVHLLFIFYKSDVVVIGNKDLSTLSQIADYCKGIYKLWSETKSYIRQNIEYSGITYTLRPVSERGVDSKTILINLAQTTIEKDMKCGVKTYKY